MSIDVALLVGHSTTDPGAIAIHSGRTVTERAWCLPLAEVVAGELARLGRCVRRVERPPGKGGYGKLPGLVNATGARCCVELHLNAAANAGATGTETLCWHLSKRGNALAIAVQLRMVAALGLRDRGVKLLDGEDRGAPLLRRTSMPAIIVEPFFLSSSSDFAVGDARRPELGLAIAAGVNDWLRTLP